MFLAAGCSKATHLLEKRLGASGVLLTLSTAACIGYIGMAISNSWIGVVAGFLFYINRGLAAVIFTDAFKLHEELRVSPKLWDSWPRNGLTHRQVRTLVNTCHIWMCYDYFARHPDASTLQTHS